MSNIEESPRGDELHEEIEKLKAENGRLQRENAQLQQFKVKLTQIELEQLLSSRGLALAPQTTINLISRS